MRETAETASAPPEKSLRFLIRVFLVMEYLEFVS